MVQARAPYVLARALAATVVVVTGALSAHTWSGGTVPTAPGLALVAAVVLVGGLLLFTRRVPLWALLPVVAVAQLGLHESFGLVAGQAHHHTAASPGPGWTWQMVAAHSFVTAAHRGPVVGRPARRVLRRRPSARPPRSRLVAGLRRCAAVASRSRSSLAHLLVSPRRGPPRWSCPPDPVRSGGVLTRDPTPGPTHIRRTMSTRSLARALRAPRRHRGPHPVLRRCPPAPTSAPPSPTRRPVPSRSPRSACPTAARDRPPPEIEIQVPESVLSVTPTRNPSTTCGRPSTQLDEPVTDGHGNEVTERTPPIVYTAETPLPDGQRDTFELSFQVPDAEGEMLVFPTIQTCEKGETDVDPGRRPRARTRRSSTARRPPSTILPASGERSTATRPLRRPTTTGPEGRRRAPTAADEPTRPTSPTTAPPPSAGPASVAGLLGLAAGGLALARTRSTT